MVVLYLYISLKYKLKPHHRFYLHARISTEEVLYGGTDTQKHTHTHTHLYTRVLYKSTWYFVTSQSWKIERI